MKSFYNYHKIKENETFIILKSKQIVTRIWI